MSKDQTAYIMRWLVVFCSATALSGCATPAEKTAPCKRPANLTAFSSDIRSDCGEAQPVNDRNAALAAIAAIAGK